MLVGIYQYIISVLRKVPLYMTTNLFVFSELRLNRKVAKHFWRFLSLKKCRNLAIFGQVLLNLGFKKSFSGYTMVYHCTIWLSSINLIKLLFPMVTPVLIYVIYANSDFLRNHIHSCEY